MADDENNENRPPVTTDPSVLDDAVQKRDRTNVNAEEGEETPKQAVRVDSIIAKNLHEGTARKTHIEELQRLEALRKQRTDETEKKQKAIFEELERTGAKTPMEAKRIKETQKAASSGNGTEKVYFTAGFGGESSVSRQRIETEVIQSLASGMLISQDSWVPPSVETAGTTLTPQARTAATTHEAGAVEQVSALGRVGSLNTTTSPILYDVLDMVALQTIDLLQTNLISFAQLTQTQLNTMYRYFYRSNPIIAQIIDLHTDLPLSKLKLSPPPNQPELIKDYVVYFFEKIIKRTDLLRGVKDIVRDMNLYGLTNIVVDDYTKPGTELKDYEEEGLTKAPSKTLVNDDKTDSMIALTDKRYRDNPDKVDADARRKYLEAVFLSFEDKYRGPDRIISVNPLEVIETLRLREAGYYGITVENPIPESSGEDREIIHDALTPGWKYLIKESQTEQRSALLISNSPYTEGPWVVPFGRPMEVSMLRRVLTEAIQYEYSRRASLANISMVGKIGRIYMVDSAVPVEEVEKIKSELELLHLDPRHSVVVNYQITTEDVGGKASEQLAALADTQENVATTMGTALGMPLSFISNESQYSNASVTTETINTVYGSLRELISTQINNHVLRPISIRKGLYRIDAWGEVEVVFPRLSLAKMPLRDDQVIDTLTNLYLKGSLPVGVLYEIYNLDQDDIERGLQRDLFSLRDPNFNSLVQSIYAQMAQDLINSPDILRKIFKAIKVPFNPDQITDEETVDDGGSGAPPADFPPPGGGGGPGESVPEGEVPDFENTPGGGPETNNAPVNPENDSTLTPV